MDVHLHSRHKEHRHLCVEQWRDGGEAGEVSGSQIQGLVQHLWGSGSPVLATLPFSGSFSSLTGGSAVS